MSKLSEIWNSDKSYAAKKTAVITFISLFGLQLLGFLSDVAEWAGATDRSFPSVSPLGKAAVSAAAAALTGLVNYFVNAGQEKGVIPGKAPSYAPEPPKPE